MNLLFSMVINHNIYMLLQSIHYKNNLYLLNHHFIIIIISLYLIHILNQLLTYLLYIIHLKNILFFHLYIIYQYLIIFELLFFYIMNLFSKNNTKIQNQLPL